MSLKPPKKSDLNKSWMKQKPDRAIKIQPEYHLIVTEGTDTEPSYIYRHVGEVYDTDDFPAEHIDHVLQLCEENSTEETQFHDIWSNQCIELWFLLHFSFMHADIHRTEYWPKLSECLKKLGAGEYEKNRKDMYWILRPYMEAAIENAKKLDVLNEGKTASQAAPGTKVHELIEKLKPYLGEG